MGIQDGGKLLWHAEGLTLQSLKDLGIGNRIDVDGNLMAYSIGSSGNKPFHEVINEMALRLKKIAQSGGLNIQVVVDGDIRPDCKRASWSRRKEQGLDKINRKYCRLKAMELRGQIDGGTASNIDKEKYESFSAEAKRLETKCGRQCKIPNDFCERLGERLLIVGATDVHEGGGIVQQNVLKAKFQADTLIARRFREKKCEYILSNDSDFGAMIGDECILITSVKNANGRPR